MKRYLYKTITACMLFTIILPITTTFASTNTNSIMAEEKFTGWYTDRETRQTMYYDNGKIAYDKWIKDNDGNMCYVDANGKKFNGGWLQLNKNWYYLDSNGEMQKGWIKDMNGDWYYLNISDGVMAHDTTIDGYQLGSNGTWIK